MIDPATVAALVRAFSDPADGEALKSRELILLLLECGPAPLSRYTFTPGHITCSGLVLAPDGERVLLVHHRRLDRWLLPGGHVEPDDPEIWDAARREVVEETGAVLAPNPPVDALVGVDVHGIPMHGRQPYHLHHDLTFFFQAVSEEFHVSEESRAVAWCAPSAFDAYSLPVSIRRAWSRVRKLSSSR
ncbi:MAG TPA: NUDIX domain-containing protein [Bryobacteraceae bacterium]|nr:NUDIX domain-containing protein [Bryobacteraceae bacterium]